MARRERLPGTPVLGATWTNREGMTLRGDAWGPEDGPQVLLLHGGGQARYAWRATGMAASWAPPARSPTALGARGSTTW